MTEIRISNLFDDFRMFALFKEWMESKKASEVVTAYVWLLKLLRTSPASREQRSLEFRELYIGDGAPKQLNLTYDTLMQLGGISLTDRQINIILAELELTIQENWVDFCMSPLHKRFLEGEYEPRISQGEARRFKFFRRARSDSDELVVEHFKARKLIK